MKIKVPVINKKRCLVCRKTFIPTKELKKFCSTECQEKRKKEKVKKAVQRFRKNEGAKKANQSLKKTETKFKKVEQAVQQIETETSDLLTDIMSWRQENFENEQTYHYTGETYIRGIEIHDPEFEIKVKELIGNGI